MPLVIYVLFVLPKTSKFSNHALCQYCCLFFTMTLYGFFMILHSDVMHQVITIE